MSNVKLKFGQGSIDDNRPALMLTGDGHYIINTLLEEWGDYFVEKQADYQDAHKELGVKAQFVDINRKVVKLRRAIWDGHELVGEQPREILMDLIGHCFLTIAMMDDTKMAKVDP